MTGFGWYRGAVGRLRTKDGEEVLCVAREELKNHGIFLDTAGNRLKVNFKDVEDFQLIEIEDLQGVEYCMEFYSEILHKLIYKQVRYIDDLGYKIRYLRGGFLLFEDSGPYWKRARAQRYFGYNRPGSGSAFMICDYEPISKEDIFNNRKAVHIRVSRKNVSVELLKEIAKQFKDDNYEHEIEVVKPITEDRYPWDKLEMENREIVDALSYLKNGDLCYIKWGRMKNYEKVVIRSIANKAITVSNNKILKRTLSKSSIRGIMGVDPAQKLEFMLKNEDEFAGMFKEMLNDHTEGHIAANNYVVSFDKEDKVLWVARKRHDYNNLYEWLGHRAVKDRENFKSIEVTALFNGVDEAVGLYKDGLRIKLTRNISEEVVMEILSGIDIEDSRCKRESWEEALNKSIYADAFESGDVKELKLKGNSVPILVVMRCVLLKGISAVGASGGTFQYTYIPDIEIESMRDVSRDELHEYGEFRVEFGAHVMQRMIKEAGFKGYNVRVSIEDGVLYIEKNWMGDKRLAHPYVFGEAYNTYYEMRSGEEGDSGIYKFDGNRDSIAVRSRSGKITMRILEEIVGSLYLVESEGFSAGFDRLFLMGSIKEEEIESLGEIGCKYEIDDIEEEESVLSMKLEIREVKEQLEREREENRRIKEKLERVEELLEYIRMG